MVSSRLKSIHESPTVSMSNIASELTKKGIKVYNFGIGEPDFTTPENIINYAFEMAKKGKTHYTPSNGIPELRERISAELKNDKGIDVAPSNILISPTKFSINLSLLTLLEIGDEVLLPEPYYVSYPDIIRLSGGKVLSFNTTEDYEFDFDELRKLVTPKTRAFILNNPTNPTGKVYSEKTLRRLSDFLIENDLYLISDEIYEELIYEGKMFSPSVIPEMAERSITMSGFSKSYAMTGWRIGYMYGPEDIIKASNKVQQQTITCAASVSQYAALEALNDKESPKRMREEFRRRRELIMKLIGETGRFDLKKPEGTFYVFPKYSAEISSKEFSEKLLKEKQVIVTPGSAFGEQGEQHIRISYAASDEVINEGVDRLNKFISEI